GGAATGLPARALRTPLEVAARGVCLLAGLLRERPELAQQLFPPAQLLAAQEQGCTDTDHRTDREGSQQITRRLVTHVTASGNRIDPRRSFAPRAWARGRAAEIGRAHV